MPNKSLNFKTKMWIETSEKSHASTDRSIGTKDNAESESPESETCGSEFPFFRKVQKRLKKTLDINVTEHDAKYKLLRSDSGKSSMIPAKSLAKSAFSTKFARYEIWESPSASILDAIPKVSCFRRKNCDRCLSCMHKSLRKMEKTEDISSRTTLLTAIEGKEDSESSSDELSEFHEEFRKIYSQKEAKYREKIEDLSGKAVSNEQCQVKEENTVMISMKIDLDQSKDKASKPAENLLSKDPKSLKAVSSSISISSEKSKISSSDAHTSDEETSSPLALDNDPSQYKTMAPCHLPTILLHSLEPLRALKHRKATTMEARIALMESVASTKDKSDEEYYDDVKSETSKTPKNKLQPKVAEKIVDEKDTSLKSPKVLLNVKSQQQLISSIAQPARKDDLKRGYSCTNIENLSKISARSTFETPRSEEEDGREKVISSDKVDSARESASSGLVEADKRAELPLLTVAEISRFLAKASRSDASAAIMLQTLADEFSSRVIKQYGADSTAVMRRAKLAARLTKLLADSKCYLSPDKFPSDLVFSAKQPPVCNSRLLRRILPLDSYNLVAPLLGMSKWYPKRVVEKIVIEKPKVHIEDEEEIESEIPFSLIVCN